MMTANRADTLFRREGVIEMHGHAAREEKSLRHALAGKEVEKVVCYCFHFSYYMSL